jgi:hypothetical protein
LFFIRDDGKSCSRKWLQKVRFFFCLSLLLISLILTYDQPQLHSGRLFWARFPAASWLHLQQVGYNRASWAGRVEKHRHFPPVSRALIGLFYGAQSRVFSGQTSPQAGAWENDATWIF